MCSYVLRTVVLLVLLSLAWCQRGDILNGPKTQIVPPGEIVTFICHARGNRVYWYINGRYADPQVYNEARGFTITNTEIPRPPNELEEHNNTLTVEARPSNNNTLITCTASGFILGQQDFQEGRLIIAGPPLRPAITNFSQQDVVDSSNFTYYLSWSTPFTWPGYPIISYNVTVFNHLYNESITTILYGNDSHPPPLSHDGISYGDSCYGLTFYVAANNSIGEGDHSAIQSGHHIVPGEIGDIETVVTFLSDGTPHLWMSFLAPRICPSYQTGTYSISIYDDSGVPIHDFPQNDYKQESENEMVLIVKELRVGLSLSKHYVIGVTTSSDGIVQHKTGNFSTFLDVPDMCDTFETSSQTEYIVKQYPISNFPVTIPVPDTSDSSSEYLYIVPSLSTVVGVLLTLLVSLIIAMFMTLYIRHKRKNHDSSMNADGVHTQNPVFEEDIKLDQV